MTVKQTIYLGEPHTFDPLVEISKRWIDGSMAAQGIQVYCMNRRFTVADMPGYGKANLQTEAGLFLSCKLRWNGSRLRQLTSVCWFIQSAAGCSCCAPEVEWAMEARDSGLVGDTTKGPMALLNMGS